MGVCHLTDYDGKLVTSTHPTPLPHSSEGKSAVCLPRRAIYAHEDTQNSTARTKIPKIENKTTNMLSNHVIEITRSNETIGLLALQKIATKINDNHHTADITNIVYSLFDESSKIIFHCFRVRLIRQRHQPKKLPRQFNRRLHPPPTCLVPHRSQ